MAQSKRYRTAPRADRPRAQPTRSPTRWRCSKSCAARRSSTRASTSRSTSASIRKHADQMVRGAIVLPHGIGKSVRILVFAKGEKEQRGARGGRRLRRRRGPRQEDHGRGLARLRPRDRDARHDGRRRPARQGARPARPDAEPEARHRHAWTSRARCARTRRARSSTGRQGGHHPRRRSARTRSTPQKLVDNATALIDAIAAREAGVREGHLHEEDHDLHHDGSGHPHRSVVGRDGQAA